MSSTTAGGNISEINTSAFGGVGRCGKMEDVGGWGELKMMLVSPSLMQPVSPSLTRPELHPSGLR